MRCAACEMSFISSAPRKLSWTDVITDIEAGAREQLAGLGVQL